MVTPIYDDIRKAIKRSDMSRYRIAKETDIGESQLCQFMSGNKGLSVEALEKLAECLGLEIKARPLTNKKKARRKDG